MKKSSLIVLAILAAFCFSGCAKKQVPNNNPNNGISSINSQEIDPTAQGKTYSSEKTIDDNLYEVDVVTAKVERFEDTFFVTFFIDFKNNSSKTTLFDSVAKAQAFQNGNELTEYLNPSAEATNDTYVQPGYGARILKSYIVDSTFDPVRIELTAFYDESNSEIVSKTFDLSKLSGYVPDFKQTENQESADNDKPVVENKPRSSIFFDDNIIEVPETVEIKKSESYLNTYYISFNVVMKGPHQIIEYPYSEMPFDLINVQTFQNGTTLQPRNAAMHYKYNDSGDLVVTFSRDYMVTSLNPIEIKVSNFEDMNFDYSDGNEGNINYIAYSTVYLSEVLNATTN